MEELIKNLPHAQPFALKEQVQYEDGKVVSLTLAQKPGVGMTLFAFDAGEAISTHAAIIMPAGIPHAVKALTRFKMYLVVVKA